MNPKRCISLKAGGSRLKAFDGPLVSICMPAYNCGKYIQETLNCLCNQSYRNIEIVVVNDGSTDHTAFQVNAIIDDRLTLINVVNGGAARARNIAYQHSKGDHIIFFDADDHVGPDFVASQLEKMNGREDTVVLAAWGRFYHDDLGTFQMEPLRDDEISLEDWINDHWYRCNPMTTPGRVMFPKTLIERAGLWNEQLSLNDDLEFYTRLFLTAASIIFNPDAVFFYRSGISGLSGRKGREASLSLFNSVMASTGLVLKRYGQNPSVRQSCANLLQGLVYELYPWEKTMVREAEGRIKALGGSNLPFHSGGYTRLLTLVIGWKATKQLKKIIANTGREQRH